MIHIHTDELLAAVSSLRAASGEVAHASQQLQQITTHNDWTCKERNRINQNAENLRTNIRRLQEDTERYLQAASNAADAFVTEENNIKALFPGVDSVIGGLLNIGGDSGTHPGSSGNSHGGGGHSIPGDVGPIPASIINAFKNYIQNTPSWTPPHIKIPSVNISIPNIVDLSSLLT